ncbi:MULTISPECIES: hypothetical protein [unclassified Mesorhizobium]|uniref:hypothetical protein n=1 Tax=unclassified Mesorhizobium TaxID=325217 RepID=UPI000FCB9D2B|nr:MULTISPECIES: hypothetical protein [unclassified Mesorhizobium]RUW18905.1 hypothetical protein EOA34_30930 [Mesorhizobium sp. M4B.F.Ca.ET.013.02.1.1]RUW77434.1 hypothetical protein EOA31_04550 [Mesorhizobium sp. M4B.F.Ca.ET.049.02.1.2]RVD19869.1 hypothetical protein EN738_25035 [Mesorhizobium sp. M4B.F.Ca.ET.017.02.2.1]RWX62513.1 hypothetical protein EN780_26385 [Mesorhizobium sp. M4B.F.Ca.ET.089.01.1.1]TGQ06073.1 hypothetical protein EN858_28770 [Mesorhizobium sp. M4B.F.Ca.ET.215.01.1.1]
MRKIKVLGSRLPGRECQGGFFRLLPRANSEPARAGGRAEAFCQHMAVSSARNGNGIALTDE